MYQGTTPAVTLTVKDCDMSEAKAFVSFKRGQDILTKTAPDVLMTYDSDNGNTVVVCQLTQEETLAMRKGGATVQIRFIDSGNKAYATDKVQIEIEDVIYKDVISYGG